MTWLSRLDHLVLAMLRKIVMKNSSESPRKVLVYLYKIYGISKIVHNHSIFFIRAYKWWMLLWSEPLVLPNRKYNASIPFFSQTFMTTGIIICVIIIWHSHLNICQDHLKIRTSEHWDDHLNIWQDHWNNSNPF